MADDDLRWVRKLLDDPPPEPRVLIEGMLRAGELCVVGAPRGIGKTWLAYNLAVALERGNGLLFGTLEVQRPARTLLIQGEMTDWATTDRFATLFGSDRPQGIAFFNDPTIRLRVFEVTESARLMTGGSRSRTSLEGELDPRIEQAIVDHGFEVLILDPWASIFAGNENSNDQVEAGLSQLRSLALRHGTAIVILHHFGKTSDVRDPEDLWRGATRLPDWASTRITLLPHFTQREAAEAGLSPAEARCHVDVHFLRRHAPTPDFHMTLDGETGIWSRWEPPTFEVESSSFAARLETADVVRECRRVGGAWKSLEAARKSLGVSKDRTRAALDRAVEAGALVVVEDAGNAHGWTLAPAFGGDASPDDHGVELLEETFNLPSNETEKERERRAIQDAVNFVDTPEDDDQ